MDNSSRDWNKLRWMWWVKALFRLSNSQELASKFERVIVYGSMQCEWGKDEKNEKSEDELDGYEMSLSFYAPPLAGDSHVVVF